MVYVHSSIRLLQNHICIGSFLVLLQRLPLETNHSCVFLIGFLISGFCGFAFTSIIEAQLARKNASPKHRHCDARKNTGGRETMKCCSSELLRMAKVAIINVLYDHLLELFLYA